MARAQFLRIVLVVTAFGLLAAVLVGYFARGFVPGDAVVYLAAGERLNAGHLLYALSPGDRIVALKPPYWTVPTLSPPFMGVLFRPLVVSQFECGSDARLRPSHAITGDNRSGASGRL
jgi:hypothetical protein